MRLVLWAAAIAGALTPPPAAGADQWIRATTPNFELYTTEGQGRAREAVLFFEKVRTFFIRNNKAIQLPAYPVRIVAFRSEKDYRPYSPNQNASAFYQSGLHHETIVMQGLGSTFYEVAVHEYVHLVMREYAHRLPLWLQEGLAEYYSTLSALGKDSVKVGEFPKNSTGMLSSYGWMDPATLFRADQAWLARASREQAGVFYAQSWAVTHMLALSDDYRPRYEQFLKETLGGGTTAEVLQKVYGKSVEDFHADLKYYFTRSLFKAYVFPFGLEAQTAPPDIRPATPLEWGVALADLDVERPEKREQARQSYARLATENPGSWEPRMGMAYLELSVRDTAAASLQFASAEKLGCRDPRAFLHWAMYAPPEGDPRELARVFLKAAEFKPGDPLVTYRAGLGLAAAGDCEMALEQLSKLKSVTPEQAPNYLQAVAVCAHNTGQDSRAQAAAKQLLSLARTPQEEESANTFVQMANGSRLQSAPSGTIWTATRSSEAPSTHSPAAGAESQPAAAPGLLLHSTVPAPSAKRMEGLLVQVDCLGTSARLWLQTGDSKIAFLIQEGNALTLLRGGQSVQEELKCGPQRPAQKAVIRFSETTDAGSSSQGIVRVLEFP